MIRSVQGFFGRQREIDRIMARIGADTPQSVAVVGERRVGKSSLLWHVSQEEIYRRHLGDASRYLFVHLDFQGQQHLDMAGFCGALGGRLRDAAGDRVTLPEGGDPSGVQEQAGRLEEAGLRVVFLFDEFETVTRNEAFGGEFFGFLRSLANTRPVAFVTASRRELQTLCHTREISESPFFNIFSCLRLGPMVDSEVSRMIREPSADAGVPLEGHEAGIRELGGRLPFFVQVACSAAFECLVEGGDNQLDPDLLEDRFLEEASSHFSYLWEHFEPPQRSAMACLVADVAPSVEHAADLRGLQRDGYVERNGTGQRPFSGALMRFVVESGLTAADDTGPGVEGESREASVTAHEDPSVSPVPEGAIPYPEIIGQSRSIRQTCALVERAAASDVTVLLKGDTGTGKELVARTIHEHSGRSSEAFVPVNCGAIAEHLQESELFGHRKGSFTDAVADREGLIEAAHGGTLFLDEIGETTPATQVKLLRVLQDGEVRRVGETETRTVDVRLICATNLDLEEEVGEGRFREDLYFRLYVMVLSLPPLRERREDIQLLVDHFLAGQGAGISDAALSCLRSYEWPGNIRELENQLSSALALIDDGLIEPAHLWPHVRGAVPQEETPGAAPPLPGKATLREAREQFERRLVAERLKSARWDFQEAATSLGLSRSRLYELARKYEVEEK